MVVEIMFITDNIVMWLLLKTIQSKTQTGRFRQHLLAVITAGLPVYILRDRKMNINERTIGIVKYCRENGYKKTLDILWFEYNHKLITSKTFDSIVKVLKTKRMHINY